MATRTSLVEPLEEVLQEAEERTTKALRRLREEIKSVQREVEKIQKKVEDLIPMGVRWKYKKCGRAGCRCSRGLPHGPYPYLRQSRDGRKHETYLGKGWEPPPGLIRPMEFRRQMKDLEEKRARLEALLERLYRALDILERGRE